MSWGNITDLPVLKYAAIQQATFTANYRDMGHEPKTTFYGDLSIAEFYGPASVQETFDRAKTDWGDNVEYWTEFVICLNWKIWQWHKKTTNWRRYIIPYGNRRTNTPATRSRGTIWTISTKRQTKHGNNGTGKNIRCY